MAGTGAPKGNKYRKGKRIENPGRTIGLYISGVDLLYLEEELRTKGEHPSQQAADALARALFKEMMQKRRSGFFNSRKNSSEKG